MKTTVQRIKEFIDFKGMSVRSFEKKVNFSNGAFASQFKNRKNIGSDKIENILQTYPDINPRWLLTGNGQMLLNNENIDSNPEMVGLLKKIIKLQEQNAILKDQLLKIKKEQEPDFYGQIAAEAEPELIGKKSKH